MMNGMRLFISILFTAFTALTALGQDTRLDKIHELLLPMQGHHQENLKTRGATLELTVVKHELRDWIESRLPESGPREDLDALTRRLNSELKAAKLFDFQSDSADVDEETLLGILGDIQIFRPRNSEFLIVKTAVGILCGFDESAYGYMRTETNAWRRVWQSEQTEYSENKYLPQMIHAVLISPTDYTTGADKSEHLVLTLGTDPWCTSNWHSVYYRVWQTKSSYPEPELLLDESEMAFLGSDPPIQGSVGSHDVIVEFTTASVDTGFLTRQQTRHYVVDNGKVRRVNPVALSPRGFVDEWLTRPWTESSAWTETASSATLKGMHGRLNGGPNRLSGEFENPSLHCQNRTDAWQVGIHFFRPNEHVQAYFLVRWRPPYRFTMLGVSDHPWRGCTEEDREADEPRTLFPVQDWR